ncbi:helix-turn-helix domain-containing protein [Flammeovirga pectinis]|uniref:Helix-turn-helix domain-containing protein n=1 Tax=Flammeovirga pectinis TaxID=2494373 RepID=A0A3Q9FQE0_9BACT|nr:helix-turn-helix domain-containing protein [Flammeovirga pectinis]AZQ63995.1 helix-turn-helix domain-containing protein [Flammeovirga pectinis]
MNQLPILNIKEFENINSDATFYANSFIPHLKQHHHSIMAPHKHDFYLIVLFTKGSGTHEIDFNSYTVKPGSVFLLNPGQTHYWTLSDDIDGFVFFHSKSFYDMGFNGRTVNDFPFFFSTQNSPCVYLDKIEIDKFITIFKEVVEEYEQDLPLKRQKIVSLIDVFYIEISRYYVDEATLKNNKSNRYAILFREFEELIESTYKTEKSPQFYAKKLNISPKHLNRIIKELIGKTSSELITERVILEAKRLLIHSKQNFNEIAYTLGYEDYSYFSRIFKNKSGDNPSVFQEKYI